MKTTAAKLLIKPGAALWLSHPDRVGLVGALPAGVIVTGGPEESTVALVFADDAASVRAVVDADAAAIAREGRMRSAHS